MKHVLVIDNKQSKVVVNFSIEYHENSHDYTCNGFILKYVKSPEEFHLMGVNIEDYAHMMNFVDFISDNEAKNKRISCE